MQDGRKLIAWLEQQGYFEDALKECDILIAKDPDDTDLRAFRASLLVRCGRPEEAIALYGEVAMEWSEKGQYLRAISCSKAVALLDFSAYEKLSRRLATFYNKRYATPGATNQPLPFSEITASIPVSVLGSEALLGDQDSSGEMPITWVEPPRPSTSQVDMDAPSSDALTAPPSSGEEPTLYSTVPEHSSGPPISSPFEPMNKPPSAAAASSHPTQKKRRTGENEKQRTGENEKQRTGENEKQRTGENEKQRTGENEKQRTGGFEKQRTGGFEKQRTGGFEKQQTGEADSWTTDAVRQKEASRKESQKLPSLFSRLDADSTAALMDYLFPVEAPKGKVLMQQGEYGNEFFLISEGRVVLTRRVDGEEEVLVELGPGQFFGEIALLTPLRRTATVTCLEDCQLLRLTREDLRNVVQSHPNVDTELRRFVYQRLIQNLLLTSLLFFALSTEDRVSFVEFFSVLEGKAGVVLVREEQPSDALYLIAGGTAELLKRKGSEGEVSVQHLGVGDFFGESAILGRDSALYSARLAEDCILLKLRADGAAKVRPRFPKAIEIVRNISEQRRREIHALSSMWAI
ncbi:cyclic nucleotide-binding domain-containing protein [Myxococcota bacterium]|nr:cyclic nucleotide-binding domain-containing protein [Myxococcota bacterium]